MTKEEFLQDYEQRKKIAIIGECLRDIPTFGFLYFGGAEAGLTYYAITTWLADRWAYSIGCAGC